MLNYSQMFEQEKILHLLSSTEGLKLEFKSKFYKIYKQDYQNVQDPDVKELLSLINKIDKNNPKPKDSLCEYQWGEFIKDIISLANGNYGTAHEYGYLIIGADNKLKEGNQRKLYDVGDINIDQLEQQISKKVEKFCHPPIVNIKCKIVNIQESKILVICIPPTPDLHETREELITISNGKKKHFEKSTVFVRRNEGICTPTDAERENIKADKRKLLLASSQSSNILIEDHKKYVEDLNELLSRFIKNYVERKSISKLIDNFLNDNDSGYLTIEAEPGAGKTTLIAQYIHKNNGLAFFFGHGHQGTRVEQFIKSIYSQLIFKYRLTQLSAPNVDFRDIDLLVRFLREAKDKIEKNQKIIIAVDALDEVEFKESFRENILNLPRVLPTNVYFILSNTPGSCPNLILSNTPEETIKLNDYYNDTQKDIKKYITETLKKTQIKKLLKNTNIKYSKLVELLTQKSENNFRYIYEVIKDLQKGKIQSIEQIEQLPTGLESYYQKYLKDMEINKDNPVSKTKLKVACLLVNVKQAISCTFIANLIEETLEKVENIITEWDYLLQKEIDQEDSEQIYYCFYHTSFRNFLNKHKDIKHAKDRIPGIQNLDWTQKENLNEEQQKYIIQHLVNHLVDARKKDEVIDLLTDFSFLEAKITRYGLGSILQDYDSLFSSNILSTDELEILRLIPAAIRLSQNILSKDNQQLAAQLLGRLLFSDNPWLNKMLNQAKEYQSKSWLMPLNSSLQPPGNSLLCTLRGHEKGVRVIALYCDGKKAISGDFGGILKIWDLNNGNAVLSLESHTDTINAIAVTPDEKKVISASDDCTLKIYDLTNGKVLHNLIGHESAVNAVVVTPNNKKIVSASDDCTLKVWDLSTGQLLTTLEGHKDPVKLLDITSDSKFIVSASDDFSLKVWNLNNSSIIYTLTGHVDQITSLILIPKREQVISASLDQTLKLWDLKQGECIKTFQGHSDRIIASAVTSNGVQLVSASEDGELRIWDLQNLQRNTALYILKDDENKLFNDVIITFDCKQIVTAYNDTDLIKIWDVDREEIVNKLADHTNRVNAIAITPNTRRIISGSKDGTLKLWDLLIKDKYSDALERHNKEVKILKLTKDGRYAVSASDDKSLKYWSLAQKYRPYSLPFTEEVSAMAITPDNNYVIAGYSSGDFKVWNLPDGKEVKKLDLNSKLVRLITVTPDTKLIISASADEKNLKVLDFDSGKLLYDLKDHDLQVNAIATWSFYSNLRCIITASDDKTLKLWDLDTGRVILDIRGHKSRVINFAIDSKNKRVVSSSDDNTIKVWDLSESAIWESLFIYILLVKIFPNYPSDLLAPMGKVMYSLEDHTDLVKSIVLTSDGRNLVTASCDKTIKVWNLDNGKLCHNLVEHTDIVNGVSLSPDNKYIISASNDWTIKVWSLNTGKAIATFTGDSEIVTCDTVSNKTDGTIIVAGEKSGRVHFLRFINNNESNTFK